MKMNQKNISNVKEKLFVWVKKIGEGPWIIFILCGAILAVMALPTNDFKIKGNESTTQAIEISNMGKTQLEMRLENFLENVEGVGKVQAMIMVQEEGNEMFSDKEIQKVTGILISAQGANNAAIQKKIQDAVMALFQIEAHKIKVMNMK